MSLGPVMLDIQGTALTAEDRERLRHPLTGGLILFSRNYESPEQIAALVEEIHGLRHPRLLVAGDHEGGRVERYRGGFTRLPACRRFGEIHDENPKRALRLAGTAGWLMAAELRAVDIDFSFAPVLDLDRGISAVIGDRAFHGDPEVVAALADAYLHGMRHAGMGELEQIARDAGMPASIALSTQPALSVVAVQSPARNRLRKPDASGGMRKRIEPGVEST